MAALVVLLRTLRLLFSGHRALALENMALRQQLSVLRRTVKRPRLRTSDRLFWLLLARAWRDWRTALIVVQPDTVVRWHRLWLRAVGPNAQPEHVRAARAPLRPFGQSSTR